MPNSQCVILVPVYDAVELGCDDALRQLERAGYVVWRVPGFAAIDQARCRMASEALRQGFEELMWIDSDIQFEPAVIERLRAHNLPLVAGLYPKKGVRALASSLLPGTREITFGEGGGLLEIRYAAAGFLHTRRQVYLDIQRHAALPVCNEQFAQPLVPFFLPLVIESDVSTPEQPRHWYLSEDFAFCHRARAAGHKIFADTTIRLAHLGRYPFGWEDAGTPVNRYQTFHFHVREL